MEMRCLKRLESKTEEMDVTKQQGHFKMESIQDKLVKEQINKMTNEINAKM